MRINLKKSFFSELSEEEFVLAENTSFCVSAFKYSTGVEALRVKNSKGYFIILPFQGQQIWRAGFMGRELVMKTLFDKPYPTTEYLETYGGFLLHCGINAFGVPQADDTHKQHGEIPNAEYKNAYIELEEDYVAVGGSLNYDKSFVKSYTFSPECRLYKDDTVLKVSAEIKNRRKNPMEYMYLCHINFRPIDGAELIYTGNYSAVRPYVNGSEPEELKKYLERLEKTPELHHKVGGENQSYDPEICFKVDYFGDEDGRAYTMQYYSEGADFVSHPTDTLPMAIRWISRTGNEASMGMVLPATAEHLGYSHAKRNGQIRVLPPEGSVKISIEAGCLDNVRASKMKEKIEKMRDKK